MKKTLWFCLLFALGLSLAATAQPAVAPSAEKPAVDLEASLDLIIFRLPEELLVAGDNVLALEARSADGPLFSERIVFDSEELPAPPESLTMAVPARGLSLLAGVAGELLGAMRNGLELTVELSLNGEEVYNDALGGLVEASDRLRAVPFVIQPASSTLYDRRDWGAEAAAKALSACATACHEEHEDCLDQYCFYNYNEYMCTAGCDANLDACLDECNGGPSTCTPGLIGTQQLPPVLVSTSYAGSGCFQGIFSPGEQFNRWWNTYSITTVYTYRRIDCSTYKVYQTTTESGYCYQATYLSCPFPAGFAVPLCY